MTKELGKMEENYVALFIGKSHQQTYEFSFDFIPGQKTVKGEVFSALVKIAGCCQKLIYQAGPLY